MTYRLVDMQTWPRADQFRFFKTYQRPHYAITSRLDISALLTTGKANGISANRACLFAIGAGIHAVPELKMRFEVDQVKAYERIDLSMTVPTKEGSFNYAYVPFHPEFAQFDASCIAQTKLAAEQTELQANTGARDDLVYLSCLPWLDYSSLNNAMPHADDCIPRVSWGKFVEGAPKQWSMAMTLEVHHALVDGAQVGNYFEAVQDCLRGFGSQDQS